MEPIGGRKLWSYVARRKEPIEVTSATVRGDLGHQADSYLDLATKIADLQYRNQEYVFLFRGQRFDYQSTKNNTSLKPTLFRSQAGIRSAPGPDVLSARFNALQQAEELLLYHLDADRTFGRERIQRFQVLRWAILQHYEVCATPLLDFTQSIRIAASFASDGADAEAYILVVGVPHISGSVTASAEAGLQVIRLASACPPCAVRPHIQEGFLVGEYPELSGMDRKQHYPHYQVDVARRLIAKFRITPEWFWRDKAFPLIGRRALYPDEDRLQAIASQIKNAVPGQP